MNRFTTVSLFYLFLSGCTTTISLEDVTPKMYELNLENITTITIEQSGITAAAQIGDNNFKCEEFRLSIHEISTYFKNASKVSKNDYWHMLDWSPCYIKGSMAFENGQKVTWTINQLRAGSITDDEGNDTYLYCPDCEGQTFQGP